MCSRLELVALVRRFRLMPTCAHTPCDRVVALSLRLSHAAAALELPILFSKAKKATPKRLRQQLASGTSESDGRERQARVRSTYLFRLCDALLQPKAASAWSVFFSKCIQKHLQTPTSKHPIHIFCRVFKNSGCEK